MNIGIYDINSCSNLTYKERLDIYKKVGYTNVGLYLDEKYMSNDESYLDIIKYAKSISLKVNQVHLDYKISNLICDESTNEYFDYVKEKLKEAYELNITFVVLHASKGHDAPILKDSSIQKLKSLMLPYKNKDIYLCFENVRDNRNLAIILDSNINNIGMCFDLGHAHCYANVEDLLNQYKNKILCTHLHNNNKADTHNLLMEGSIDCPTIIKKINEIAKVDNCLEVFPEKGMILNKSEFTQFVNRSYKEYCECCSLSPKVNS